jgi:hypothetical protein
MLRPYGDVTLVIFFNNLYILGENDFVLYQ